MIIFIPGNVPSLKNSKIKTSKGIFPSKTVTKYLRGLGIRSYSLHDRTVKGYARRGNEFAMAVEAVPKKLEKLTPPYKVGFHFVRDSQRKFDFLNAAQIICDLLVAHRVIEDDNMDCIIPSAYQINGCWYSVDKDNPGCYLIF